MNTSPIFDEPRKTFLAKLRRSIELDHYVIHFEWRDSIDGPGAGIRGVRPMGLLQADAEGLERLHAHMLACGREPTEEKTHVYVYHLFDDPGERFRTGEPFTHDDRNGVPYIGLPCRSHEPGIQDALKRARAEAVHEATHVFNRFQKLSRGNRDKMFNVHRNNPEKYRIWSNSWSWLDEATATYMEQVCYPGNDDYLRYCMNWIDLPHVSLNKTQYEGCMYLRYLDRCFRRFGKPEGQFVSDLWNSSALEETAIEAIERLTKQSNYSEPAGLLPAFGQFCADTLFLADPNSKGFAFDPFVRFGNPVVKTNVIVGGPAVDGNSLPHLAAHYFRIVPNRAKTARIKIMPESNPEHFQAFAGIQRRFFRARPDLRFSDMNLIASLDLRGLEPGDTIIVTVANCAVVSGEIKFSIQAEAK